MTGRNRERKLLAAALASRRSEFVAVYGRRRVGKTYLIRETFAGKFFFQHTGTANAGREEQLASFRDSLRKAGADVPARFKNWRETFDALEAFVERSRRRGKKILFLDELPWMDTPKSGFVGALERFWNGWASARKDVLLVVCGSATSWIVSNIVDSHGGLHNRLTHRIHLPPFTLRECEELCRANGLRMSRQQVLDAYMVFGGVPWYWEFLLPGESPAQAVDRLFFAPGAELAGEFGRLFASLFRNPGPHEAIVRALGARRYGATRGEILKAAGLADNGAATKALSELEQCGFTDRRVQPGRKSHDSIYRLVDPFSFFHLRFLDGKSGIDPDFWAKTSDSPARLAWAGLSFELACLLHVEQMKRSLGVSGVLTRAYAWKSAPDSETGRSGVQIDLVLDRNDRTVDLFEMKYARKPFAIDKACAAALRDKIDAFRETTGTAKSVHMVLVSPFGMKRTVHSDEVQAVIDLDALFT